MPFRDFQREFYDRHFSAREHAFRDQLSHPLFAAFYDRFAERILSHGRGAGTVRLLEVACGEGLLAAALRRVADRTGLDLRYTGSDLSAAAVEQAASVAPGGFVVGDAAEVARQLAQRGEPPFDLVVSKNLLHHLPDPAPFLAEAANLVAPGGRLVAAEASRGSAQAWIFSVLAPRRERWFFASGPRRNLRAFRRAGVPLVAVEPFSWLPFELLFAIRYAWFRDWLSRDDPAFLARVARVDDALTRRLDWCASYLLWIAAPTSGGGPASP